MNFQQLIHHRDALLRQARLANLAFACDRVASFAARLERAGIKGPMTLHPADSSADRFVPTLVAHAFAQSVLDEHFLDEDVIELADVLGYLTTEGFDLEFTFEVDTLLDEILPVLVQELQRAGIQPGAPQHEDLPRGGLD
jgi:hypothetical protein